VSPMIPRFTRAERALHWATALAVLTCAVTGFVLYVGWPPELIGRRTLLRDVHVIAGVLMPLPLLLAYAGRWRSAVRADVRRLARWTRADRRWLLSRGRDATGEVGKFNGGQKANAAFIAGMIPIMLATGIIMRWYDPLGVDITYRTGATFVHDWTAIATWVIVAGHIVIALSDRMSLRGMITGRVTRSWAEHRHPRWAAETVDGEDRAPDGDVAAAVGEPADRPLR
jgi:formate dehydrogenase subunit gamma